MGLRSWWRRCHYYRMGPFQTSFRCLLDRKHPGRHEFEPDRWMKR